jgi:hypothetical protein
MDEAVGPQTEAWLVTLSEAGWMFFTMDEAVEAQTEAK